MFLFPTAGHNTWYYTMNELQETLYSIVKTLVQEPRVQSAC